MLQLLLTILKILGIIVLVILGIILAVFLIVLLVPLRYRGAVSFDGKPRGGVLVSWLLRIVTVRVDYDGSALRALVRVLWVRLFDQTLWPSEKVEETPVQTGVQPPVTTVEKALPDPVKEAEVSAEAEPVPEAKKILEGDSVKQTVSQSIIEPEVIENNNAQTVKKPDAPIKKSNLWQSLKQKISRIRLPRKKEADASVNQAETFYNSLTGKYAAGQEKVALVREFLGNTDNQNTIRLIWRQVIKIIKHVLPGKLRGRVKFGFDDPATTGQILTYISPFYGVYAKTLTIEPVFDEKVMEGELHLKGRIRLGTLLWNVVRVFLNKNFRTLLKKLLKRSK